jgi:hypothetical protein
VVAERVGREALDIAHAAGIELRSLGELEDQLVDLRAYRATLTREFESGGLARAYVPQRFTTGEDALAVTLSWLFTDGPRMMLLAGAGGSGKSSFMRRLAYELSTRAAEDEGVPTPLLIDLLQTQGSVNLESVVQEHLRRAIGWHGNPEAILYLLRTGRVVILLDGLDELSSTTTELGAEAQLRSLARPTFEAMPSGVGNRMIVSFRKEFVLDMHSASDEFRIDPLAKRLGAAVREIAPFDDAQIRQFVRNKLGKERAGSPAVSVPGPKSNVPLAQSPLYLDLMAKAAKLLGGSGTVSAAQLFREATGEWIDARVPGSPFTPTQRQLMLEALANYMWRLPQLEPTFSSIAGMVRLQLSGGMPDEEVDHSLRSAPFLVRSDQGTYRFVHRAFLEYFLACHLLTEASGGEPPILRSALATEPLSSNCVSLFAELVPDAERGRIIALLQQASGRPTKPGVADNARLLLDALG